MSIPILIEEGKRAVLVFSGPDAVRYLNGQVTQDVRRVLDEQRCLPSCVTDAKGRVQFRVWLSPAEDGAVRVDAPWGCEAELEIRMTRYMIADDAEFENRTGTEFLWHVVGGEEGHGVVSTRWGVEGRDFWTRGEARPGMLSGLPIMAADECEDLRIARKIPSPGRELVDGVFPAELGLDESDVSFRKGCYIGQEVISRIKSAGKVNKRLAKLRVDGDFPKGSWVLLDQEGADAGLVTSVSPLVKNGKRSFLALLKRGRSAVCVSMNGQTGLVQLVDED